MTLHPSPAYELSQDGSWQGTIRVDGKVPQNLWRAEQSMEGFHALSNTSGRCCAISGLGRYTPENSNLAWSDPGLTISHIIPPQHFEVYPVDKSDLDGEDDELAEKWRLTWDPRENGIVLLGHFHALWEARLVGIEPSTLTIRCFGPYDSISIYEGKKAHFSNIPNRGALRWHYEMCVFENITAKQPPQSLCAKQDMITNSIPPALSSSSTKPGSVPFAASEALPFALPPPGPEQTSLQAARPRKRPRSSQDGPASPQPADSAQSNGDLSKQLCTLKCILLLGDPVGSDPSCPNFSKHRRPIFGTAVHKLDMATLSSWGLLRDEEVPKSQLYRESIVSEYEIVSSSKSIPMLKVVLPYGYTVIGKGVVRREHSNPTAAERSNEPAFTPLTEADILGRLGPHLAGECVPFCLGLLKLGRELRDASYDGPIDRVLLLSSADVPLPKAGVPRHRIRDETRRTVEDIRRRGVTLRTPLAAADLRWNKDAQRVMVVSFAAAKIEATSDTAVFR